MTEIELSLERHVATVRLNAVKRLNALTPEMNNELQETFLKLGADPAVRVIVITGTGPAFCAGAEVGGLAARAEAIQESGAAGPDPSRSANDTGFTPRRCRIYKPVITAVNGVCAGAGLHFVADADICIAGASATFLDPHTTVGQVAALEPILFIRGGVPMNTVMRMVIMGRAERVDAAAALRAGFVSEVVPDAELEARTMEIAQMAASASPAAVQASIRAVWESMELSLSQAYQMGYEAIGAHRTHPDAVEGAKAFIEKRPPVWSDA